MRHSTCRRALLDDRRSPAVTAHLGRCERCRRLAASLASVAAAAPSLAPGPPRPDLADVVLAGVRARRPGATGGDPRGGHAGAPASLLLADAEPAPDVVVPDVRLTPSGEVRPVLHRVVAVAAAVVLVVGVAAALATGIDDGREQQVDAEQVLLAAAARAETLDSARFTLEGSFTSTIRLPRIELPAVTVPDLSRVGELPTMDDLPFLVPQPGSTPEAHAEQERRLREELRRRMEASGERLREGLTQGRAVPWPELPEEVQLSGRFEGEGAVAAPDRLRFEGRSTVDRTSDVDGLLEEDPAAASVELVVVDGHAYLRTADGWVRWPASAHVLGPLLLEGDGLPGVLRHRRGAVEDLGVEDLDGVEVRHLRFESSPPPDGRGLRHRVEAWVGVDDDVVRRITTTTEGTAGRPDGRGPGVRHRSTVTLEVLDIGQPVSIEAPPAEQVVDGGSLPFGVGPFVYPHLGPRGLLLWFHLVG